jgi:hypothetical protein
MPQRVLIIANTLLVAGSITRLTNPPRQPRTTMTISLCSHQFVPEDVVVAVDGSFSQSDQGSAAKDSHDNFIVLSLIL